MPTTLGRGWRAHPILTAAAGGACLGVARASFLEIAGALHKNSQAILPLFLDSPYGVRQANIAKAIVLLSAEFAGNMLGYALLCAVPVALIVGGLRIFRSIRR
jgi:hypothetical protein